ncbi:MAG TPA: 50S ribosomal protein L3 [Candidatus Dependentiae bacterium]|nr:50S ribosomal protein L3 [Candidatus Dependentiae bacterium]HRQ62298.1 50S ribosomal protein L3 [Candidatus Dependentiae bacterium]
MVKGLWGKKIGMTQIFSNDAVIPVTAVDISNWVVTNIKTKERDGYDAIQMGHIRKRYHGQPYQESWLKSSTKYFDFVKEIRLDDALQDVTVGHPLNFNTIIAEGDIVDVSGITKGSGFAGVVKRHGFGGGPKSHGSMFKRIPGSISFMRSQGRVIKGKRMPGHMGVQKRMMRNLSIAKIEPEAQVVLVKGSVPGKAGSLIFIRKA